MLPMRKMADALIGSRILLIDDSVSFRRLTAAMLDKFGVSSVTVAGSLAEGMREMNYLNKRGICNPSCRILPGSRFRLVCSMQLAITAIGGCSEYLYPDRDLR